MITLDAVMTLFPDLDPPELVGWIEQSWVRPEPADGGRWVFDEVDLARVRLIYDLRRGLDTPPETIPLVLSLLDQIYELRCALNTVTHALSTQPREVRTAVLAALRARRDSR